MRGFFSVWRIVKDTWKVIIFKSLKEIFEFFIIIKEKFTQVHSKVIDNFYKRK